MKKPALVIMAAGMGSRYGGLKQIEPITSQGELILDFSVYDAIKAGFEEIIFVIKPEMEEAFKEIINQKMGKSVDIKYAFQDLNQLPRAYKVPDQRQKPWGTCHAVLSCKQFLNGPFAVINADDYYGPSAFQHVFDYLCKGKSHLLYEFCMAGYSIENTVSKIGGVTRGICEVSQEGYLVSIKETRNIQIKGGEIGFYDSHHKNRWTKIPNGTMVSMNFWGFTEAMVDNLESQFAFFLEENLQQNPLNCEFLLPNEVDRLLEQRDTSVKILEAKDNWYGITFKEDKQEVQKALEQLKVAGKYPERLWI